MEESDDKARSAVFAALDAAIADSYRNLRDAWRRIAASTLWIGDRDCMVGFWQEYE